mmetsp:Transcript_111062/g.192588  ORF Transcript_111062/g.192588 Transcript_111062/m.192588 type:complete len:268 (+) Transcript_111062:11-814(+)
MDLCNELGPFIAPEHSVDEHCHTWQEPWNWRSILLRCLPECLEGELRSVRVLFQLIQITTINDNHVNGFVVIASTSHISLHFSRRPFLEARECTHHVKDSTCHVALAANTHDEWHHVLRQPVGHDLLAHCGEVGFGCGEIGVFLSLLADIKGIFLAKGSQAQVERIETVERSALPSLFAKCHNPLPTFVDKLFIVEQVCLEVEQLLEQRHVVWLTLDHVREEAICLVGEQLILWDLLDPHNYIAVRHVCRHFGTKIFKVFDGEAPCF